MAGIYVLAAVGALCVAVTCAFVVLVLLTAWRDHRHSRRLVAEASSFLANGPRR